MSMEQSGDGSEVAAKRAAADVGAGDEDRLSALPDDALVLILLRLDTTAEAARTSVRSHRWRRVWTLLPELSFRIAGDSHHLRDALSASDVPLRILRVGDPDASPQSMAAWLPAAARRLSGELILATLAGIRASDGEEEAEASQRGTIELPCFEKASSICLDLGFLRLSMLPDVTSLQLIVRANGHAFGACIFHVLRICSGIKRLTLVLCPELDLEEQTACSATCVCDQSTNWKTEDLSLNNLQELEINGSRASEHEIAFVKRLLSWVKVLKTLTVTFNRSVTKSKAKELFQMFQSFSRPGMCMKFYMYQNLSKVSYAPED